MTDWGCIIQKRKEDLDSANKNLDVVRKIKNNVEHLYQRTDEQLRKKSLLQYNPGVEDPVWHKLTDCLHSLDNSFKFDKKGDIKHKDLIAQNDSLYEKIIGMRGCIVNRTMTEGDYNFFLENDAKTIIDSFRPYEFKPDMKYKIGKAVTGLLLTTEKLYRRFK